MKLAWIAGTGLALVGLFLGQVLLGGPLSLLFHWQSILLLIFGIAARGFLIRDFDSVNAAFGLALHELSDQTTNLRQIESARGELIQVASTIRKEGLLAIEPVRDQLKTPHLARMLKLVTDGLEFAAVHEILTEAKAQERRRVQEAADFFDLLADAAPLVGLIVACLQMTDALSLVDSTRAGGVVAHALIAFVYGIGAAEWFLRPLALRVRAGWKTQETLWSIITGGIQGIQTGLSPQLLDSKLKQYG